MERGNGDVVLCVISILTSAALCCVVLCCVVLCCVVLCRSVVLVAWTGNDDAFLDWSATSAVEARIYLVRSRSRSPSCFVLLCVVCSDFLCIGMS